MPTVRMHRGMLPLALMLLASSLLIGCGSSQTNDKSEIPQLLDIPEADRQAALAQRVCPVCREYLGEEQTPSKVSVLGEEIFVCSSDCESKLKQNPRQFVNAVKASESE